MEHVCSLSAFLLSNCPQLSAHLIHPHLPYLSNALPIARYDQDNTPTEEGMVDGVTGSCVLVLLLTRGVLARPFCQLEIRTALKNNVPVLLLHETDPRHGGDDVKVIEGEGARKNVP